MSRLTPLTCSWVRPCTSERCPSLTRSSHANVLKVRTVNAEFRRTSTGESTTDVLPHQFCLILSGHIFLSSLVLSALDSIRHVRTQAQKALTALTTCLQNVPHTHTHTNTRNLFNIYWKTVQFYDHSFHFPFTLCCANLKQLQYLTKYYK